MDSFRLFIKKSHFLFCQDKTKHSELLTGVGLIEPPPHHSVRMVWPPAPCLVLVLSWFSTLRRNCFSQTITPHWSECKWLYATRLFCLFFFFVIALTVNRANMSLRVIQWVGPILGWSPTNQISWCGWCCQVCFGTISSLRIYHPGCTSSTDIHAPPAAPWHLHFCSKAQWHHASPLCWQWTTSFSNHSYLYLPAKLEVTRE